MSWLRNLRRHQARENGKLTQPPTPESQLVCTVFLTAAGNVSVTPAGGVGLGTLRMVLSEAAALVQTRMLTIQIMGELRPPPVRDPLPQTHESASHGPGPGAGEVPPSMHVTPSQEAPCVRPDTPASPSLPSA